MGPTAAPDPAHPGGVGIETRVGQDVVVQQAFQPIGGETEVTATVFRDGRIQGGANDAVQRILSGLACE
jgi:hypothetical protein